MLKRAFTYLVGAEKGVAVDYERWSRSQLIERIRELEREKSGGSSSDAESVDTREATPATDAVKHTPLSTKPAISAANTLQQQQQQQQQPQARAARTKAKKPAFDLAAQNQRFIALRFAYTGWNYNGLAFQNEPTPLPTVEEEILRALTKAKLIASPDPGCCNFSRCGRTDKGVSALNQVISLTVRSRLPAGEQQAKENDAREIPYVTVLNTLLPTDIRITAVCLRPPAGFDARFSCDYRHYKYLFSKKGLDLDLMRAAAAKYEGGHDFRNFCKIDGSKQITNYRRAVLSAKIEHYKDDYYVFDLKGSAFLWHQVRCMVGILFLVGQKLEPVALVEQLLDVAQMPRKPVYDMGDDIPLVLYDCVFPAMEWLPGIEEHKVVKIFRDNAQVNGLVTEVRVKAMITEMLAQQALRDETPYDSRRFLAGAGVINIGDGKGRNYKKYVKVVDRELGDTFEAINARHREKKKRRLQASDDASSALDE